MKNVHVENFCKRFCAYVLDVLILYVAFLLLGLLNGLFHHVMNPFTFAMVCYALTCLYFALLESGEYHATLGKRILGLVVVRSSNDEPITFVRALVRNLARFINLPIYCLGYLPILFTKKSQGLHDFIAQTRVISVEDFEESADEGNEEEEEE